MSRWRQIFGASGEDAACRYFESNGFRIIERNFRTRFGEIDLVAEKGADVFIVEVKSRSDKTKGGAIEQISSSKLKTLQRMAAFYIAQKELEERPIHLSLLGLDVDLNHIKITFIPDMVGGL